MSQQKRSIMARPNWHRSVEIEIPYWFAGIGGLFGFFQRFLEFLLQQVGGVFLGFHRLLENRFPPAVLFAHGFRSGFHVAEGFWLHSLGMRDHCARLSINLQY